MLSVNEYKSFAFSVSLKSYSQDPPISLKLTYWCKLHYVNNNTFFFVNYPPPPPFQNQFYISLKKVHVIDLLH